MLGCLRNPLCNFPSRSEAIQHIELIVIQVYLTQFTLLCQGRFCQNASISPMQQKEWRFLCGFMALHTVFKQQLAEKRVPLGSIYCGMLRNHGRNSRVKLLQHTICLWMIYHLSVNDMLWYIFFIPTSCQIS